MMRAARFGSSILAATAIAAVALPCLLYAGTFAALLVLEQLGVPTSHLISMN
jgi:hypothetical protein